MRWPWPNSCFYWFHAMLKHLQHAVWHASAGPSTARTAWRGSCGSLAWPESHTFSIPSPSWKSLWCIQLSSVSSVLSGSLIELNGTCPPLAHAHCPLGPLIQTGPAAPAFSTSRQQVGINLWVWFTIKLQGTCVSASKTPSSHTLVKTRFTEGRMMLSVIQGLEMWLSPWHFHLFGAELTFPKLSKTTQLAPLLHWIYMDSSSLDHVASSCHTIRKGNCNVNTRVRILDFLPRIHVSLGVIAG